MNDVSNDELKEELEVTEQSDERPQSDDETGDTAAEMTAEPTAVMVRFRVPGQVGMFDAAGLKLERGDLVIVESERCQTVATVLCTACPQKRTKRLKRILRPVTEEDERIIERNRVREREAHQFCSERIKARELPMKLLDVDLAHSGTRAVFYFSSNERVDFRALVKDLARRFHTRIEMRQVGVRDAARHTGGTGICGRELCCATWLPAFKPISIRMAKDQNLALNHQKLSGLCGRLRCCLQYEQEIYQAHRKGLPKVGKRVVTPEGEARVKDVDVLRRKVRVQLTEGGYAQFDAAEVERPADIKQPPKPAPETQSAAPSTSEENKSRSSRRRRRRRGRRRSKQGGSGDGGNSSGGTSSSS